MMVVVEGVAVGVVEGDVDMDEAVAVVASIVTLPVMTTHLVVPLKMERLEGQLKGMDMVDLVDVVGVVVVSTMERLQMGSTLVVDLNATVELGVGV